MHYPQQSKTHYFILVFGLVFFAFGCNFSGCFTGNVQVCPPNPAGTYCADAPVSYQDTLTELIVQIRDDIDSATTIDIFGPPDTLYSLGYYFLENQNLDTREPWQQIPPVIPAPVPADSNRRPRIDTLQIGKISLVRELNEYFYGSNKDPKITDVLPADTCKCAEEIFLIQGIHPNDPDLNDGIAKGASKTRGNNLGLITAASFNYEISLQPVNNDALENSRPETFTNTCIGDEDLFREIKESGEINCPRPVITGGVIQDTAKIIRVAVVDSGFDPTFNYRSSLITDAAAFNIEYNSFGNNASPMSVIYGEAWPGNDQDENQNCFLDDYYGYDFFHDDNNPGDKQGHGTHIAYTILTANDEVGTDNVRVLPLQFGGFRANDSEFSCDLFAGICAINYASETADIINLSWGFYSDIFPDVLYEQVKNAVDSGILVVTSAGNDNVQLNLDSCVHYPSGLSMPGNLPKGVISVAALDQPASLLDYRLADYSNYGAFVDIAAPGSNIQSALVGSGNGTIRLDGTSMAAAVISRQASLLRYGPGNIIRDAEEIKLMILNNADQFPTVCTTNNKILNINNDQVLRTSIGY